MIIKSLNFTRFVASVLIVSFHYGRLSYPFNSDLIYPLLMQMDVVMSYFFVLSGFVMIIANYNKETTAFEFYKNRFARIYPVFFLISIFILVASSFKKLDLDFFYVITLIHAWIPDKANAFNVHSWTISVEVFFYLLFPLLIRLYKKFNLNIITYFILFIWCVSQIIYCFVITDEINLPIYSSRDSYFLPIFHLNEFLVGNLTGILFIKKYKNIKENNGFKINLIVLLLLVLLYFNLGKYSNNGLFAIIYAVLIIFLATSIDKLTVIFSKKIFIKLGNLSYCIYLLQYPVGAFFTNERLNAIFNTNLGLNFPFYIKLSIIIVASYFAHFLIETPARNLILGLNKTK